VFITLAANFAFLVLKYGDSKNLPLLLVLDYQCTHTVSEYKEYVLWNAVSDPLLQFAGTVVVLIPLRNFISGHVMMPGLAWEHACQIRTLNL